MEQCLNAETKKRVEDLVDYEVFFECLAEGPMSWNEEWDLRTKIMRKDLDAQRLIHDLPPKPPSTDEALREYEVS